MSFAISAAWYGQKQSRAFGHSGSYSHSARPPTRPAWRVAYATASAAPIPLPPSSHGRVHAPPHSRPLSERRTTSSWRSPTCASTPYSRALDHDVSPWPRRSSASTRKRAASGRATSSQLCAHSEQSWSSTIGGACSLPQSRYCSTIPLGSSSVFCAPPWPSPSWWPWIFRLNDTTFRLFTKLSAAIGSSFSSPLLNLLQCVMQWSTEKACACSGDSTSAPAFAATGAASSSSPSSKSYASDGMNASSGGAACLRRAVRADALGGFESAPSERKPRRNSSSIGEALRVDDGSERGSAAAREAAQRGATKSPQVLASGSASAGRRRAS